MKNIIRKGAAALTLAIGALFVVGAPALAQGVSDGQVEVGEVATTDVSVVTIAAPIVTLIISVLIPGINGYFTTRRTPAIVKGLGLIVLNAVSALVTNGLVADGSSALSATTIWTAIVGSVVSALMYFQAYKPLGLTSSDTMQKDGTLVPGKLATVGRT